MTRKDALTLYRSRFWEALSPREIALLQLSEDTLCVPFNVFHKSVEKVLGRTVFTHEFADCDKLKIELLHKAAEQRGACNA